jgi:hypothetical protein
MPTRKFYDTEFGAEPLRDLEKRDLLASSNPVHLVPLTYNLVTKAEGMEQRFQRDRKANPLFETTAAEIWIVAEIIPFVKEVRANVALDDELLSDGLQRYLRRESKQYLSPRPDDDEPLVTTIEPYIPALKKLLDAICDRRKSLRGILRLSANAVTIRDTSARHNGGTSRQAIFLLGIKGKWSNYRIANMLDDKGLKPKNKDFKSYAEMYRIKPGVFYSMKHNIKKNSHAHDSGTPILNQNFSS